MLCSRLTSILGLAALVASQTFHTVQVGDTGSFYDPPTVAALQGDVIVFVFSGFTHSVTQSTPDRPCEALQGGFNSGLYGLNGGPLPDAPIWQLTITNASAPIWYFCQATRPQSHCAQGMVGVINPPSADAYTSFRALAQQVSGTPTPNTTPALFGIGAAATGIPAATTTVPTGSPTITSTTSTSSSSPTSIFPPPTGTVIQNTSSGSSHGAVIGGAIGGSAAVCIIAILTFFLIRSKQQQSQQFPVAFHQSQDIEKPQNGMSPQRTGSDHNGIGPYRINPNMPNGRHMPTPPMPLRQEPSGNFEYVPFTFPSENNQQYADNRQTQYSVSTDAQRPDSMAVPMPLSASLSARANSEYNVHEIAKEVASLLQPGLRAAPANEDPMPSMPPMPSTDMQAPRGIRPLPNPHLSAPSISEPPASPGPPQYAQ